MIMSSIRTINSYGLKRYINNLRENAGDSFVQTCTYDRNYPCNQARVYGYPRPSKSRKEQSWLRTSKGSFTNKNVQSPANRYNKKESYINKSQCDILDRAMMMVIIVRHCQHLKGTAGTPWTKAELLQCMFN